QRWAAAQPDTTAILEQMDLPLPRMAEGQPPGLGPTVALLVGQMLLREAAPAANMPPPVQTYLPLQLRPPHMPSLRSGWQATLPLVHLWGHSILQRDADFTTLRGWLALEEGDNEQAYQHFSQTVNLSRPGGSPGRSGPLLPLRSLPLARY